MNQRDDHVSLNIFDLIDTICREFRTEWKLGNRPKLEKSLRQVPKNAQANLFYNLLETEIRYRKRMGETPSSAEYLKRYPQFSAQIRQAFDESTIGSLDALSSRSSLGGNAETVTQSFELPAANRLGDYELICELGRGGFGVVYEARHLNRNNRVALKTLPTGVDGQELNADRLHRFRKEFRSLSEINHPNLVGMQSLEVDGSQWFFTMDLIEGTDFLSFVRPHEQLDEHRLRSASKQLANGISFLHELGIVHRDLKPGNVLVNCDGRVVILDFGLVAQLQTNTELTVSRSGMFAGTPRYAAPEQMFGQRSEASDWYAFGTMIFEALAGEPPFTGKPIELLRQKQNVDPPSLLKNRHTEFPKDLAGLADGLLKRDPNQRLATNQIADVLQLNVTTRTHGSTADSQGSTASASEIQLELSSAFDENSVLIGRENQLAELDNAKQQFLNRGEPRVIFITGRSGEGKSELARAFLRPIRQASELMVLAGRCYDRESVPFKAIDCWIDSLGSFLKSYAGPELASILPDDVDLLAKIFPVLNRVKAIAEKARTSQLLMTSEKLRYRAFAALREILQLITRDHPLVLFLDDLQWGDADSVRAYRQIFTAPDPPDVLLLGTYRIDERESSPFLMDWFGDDSVNQVSATKFVSVGPLSQAEYLEFISSRLGVDVEAIRKPALSLFSETGGNPYLVEQLVDGYDRIAGEFVQVPLFEMIRSRLAQLSSDAKPLLESIAVYGQACLAYEVVEVTDEQDTAYSTLTHMRNEKLVRILGRGEEQRVDTFHDKIRETVLMQMESDQKRAWHLKIAESIERNEQIPIEAIDQELNNQTSLSFDSPTIVPRIYDLAHHFSYLEHARSLTYQILAAEDAIRAFANRDALNLLNRILPKITEDSPPATHWRIRNALVQAHQGLGQSDQAIEHCQAALRFASVNLAKIESRYNMAVTFHNISNIDKANHWYDEAWAAMGHPRSKSKIRILLNLIPAIVKILVIPVDWQKAKNLESSKLAQLEHQMLSRQWDARLEQNMLAFVEAWMRTPTAAFRTGDSTIIADGFRQASLVFHANGLHMFGRMCKGKTQHLKDIGDDLGQRARRHRYQGEIHYYSGQLFKAKREFDDGVQLLRRSGEFVHLSTVHALRWHVIALCGSASNELVAAEEGLKLGYELNYKRTKCWGYHMVAHAQARNGKLTEAVASIVKSIELLSGGDSNFSQAKVADSHGFVLMQCSKYVEARSVLEGNWDLLSRISLFAPFTIQTLSRLIASIIGPDWATCGLSRSDSRRVRQLSRRNLVFRHSFPTFRSSSLRVSGRAIWARGRAGQARRQFRAAIKWARRLEMDYELARSLLDLAAVEEHQRDENRAEAIELLKKMESVIPRAESWLLGDQFDESVIAPDFDLESCEI